MATRDIFREISGDRYDSNELIGYLMSETGTSRLDGQVVFTSFRGIPLEIRFSKKTGSIFEITVPSETSSESVELISSEIFTGIGETVGTGVTSRYCITSAVPVLSAFRIEGAFQIVPAPDDAPTTDVLMHPKPFLLEVEYPKCSDWITNISRAQARFSEIFLFLDAISRTDLAGISRSGEHAWGVSTDEGIRTTKLVQLDYMAESESHRHDEYSDISIWPELTLIPVASYYSRIGISFDSQFDLPDDVESRFRAFDALEDPDRRLAIRSAYWLSIGDVVRSTSTSMAYQAKTTAIDTLVNNHSGNETVAFKSFLEQFAPVSESDIEAVSAIYGDHYSRRSNLSHGDQLLTADLHSLTGSAHFTPRTISEREEFNRISSISQIAWLNWVSSRKSQREKESETND